MPKQNAILRITINVDFDQPAELAFMRAMLKRLNVLFAKTRPKSALNEILKGAKLREDIEAGRQRELEKRRTTASDNASNVTTVPAVVTTSPSKKEDDALKAFRSKPKIITAFLTETRYDPPEWVEKGGPTAAETGET
jgi:hypothetical protein